MGSVSFLKELKILVVNPTNGRLLPFKSWSDSKYRQFDPYVREIAVATKQDAFRFTLKFVDDVTYSKASEIAGLHSASLPSIAQCVVLYKCCVSGAFDSLVSLLGPFPFLSKCLWTFDLDWDESVYPNIGFVFKPGFCVVPESVDGMFSMIEVRPFK